MFKNRGFTLMEIIIVIAIIGVLIPILTPALSKYLARARDSSRITDLYTIRKALLVYEQENNTFPLSFLHPNRNERSIFTFHQFSLINEGYSAAFGGGGGGGGMCPAIGIICGPGFKQYQDPISCAESCVVNGWTRTDDQCSSYLNDTKFTQIIGTIPNDPQLKNPFPCLDTGDIGSYGYYTSTGSDGNAFFLLSAELETPSMANIGYNAFESAIVGGNFDALKALSKGSYIDAPGDVPYFVIYE